MSDSDEESAKSTFSGAIEAVSDHYDADVIFYSGEINYEGYGKLVTALNPIRENVILILVTNGGLANAGYQIARTMQKFWSSGKFYLYLPSYCKSAGTLVALGAHVLLVDSNSELGPLDVQLLKQDEIGTRRSGLVSKSTFDALESASFNLFEHLMLSMKRKSGDLISFKLAADLSSRMVGDLMAPIYGQISPDTIGSDWRDLQVALHYGIRLIGISGNAPPFTVFRLVNEYPSHDFVIDEDEIQNLFNEVETPHNDIFAVMDGIADLLGSSAYNEHPKGIVINLTAPEISEGEEEHGDNGDSEGEGPSQEEGNAGEPKGVARDEENDRPSNHGS